MPEGKRLTTTTSLVKYKLVGPKVKDLEPGTHEVLFERFDFPGDVLGPRAMQQFDRLDPYGEGNYMIIESIEITLTCRRPTDSDYE